MFLIIIYLTAFAFSAMGVFALIKPAGITDLVKVPNIPIDMRNEVRAVYGGFGVAIGGLLIASFQFPSIQSGVLLSVAVATLGMAFGRIVSLLIESNVGRYPKIYLAVEIIGGGALFYSWYALHGMG